MNVIQTNPSFFLFSSSFEFSILLHDDDDDDESKWRKMEEEKFVAANIYIFRSNFLVIFVSLFQM